MKTEKVDRLLEPELQVRVAEILRYFMSNAGDGSERPLEASAAVDVMLATIATLIEGHDELTSRLDFRKEVEHCASELLTVAWQLRQWKAEDGLHHYERLGGYKSDAAGGKLGPTN